MRSIRGRASPWHLNRKLIRLIIKRERNVPLLAARALLQLPPPSAAANESILIFDNAVAARRSPFQQRRMEGHDLLSMAAVSAACL
jgi:hypothetical protein